MTALDGEPRIEPCGGARPSTRPAERPVFTNDPLDTGIRPESNACSEGPGKVGGTARSTFIWEIPG
jgi:hypothetical protein